MRGFGSPSGKIEGIDRSDSEASNVQPSVPRSRWLSLTTPSYLIDATGLQVKTLEGSAAYDAFDGPVSEKASESESMNASEKSLSTSRADPNREDEKIV